jgi:hypothetical protein
MELFVEENVDLALPLQMLADALIQPHYIVVNVDFSMETMENNVPSLIDLYAVLIRMNHYQQYVDLPIDDAKTT